MSKGKKNGIFKHIIPCVCYNRTDTLAKAGQLEKVGIPSSLSPLLPTLLGASLSMLGKLIGHIKCNSRTREKIFTVVLHLKCFAGCVRFQSLFLPNSPMPVHNFNPNKKDKLIMGFFLDTVLAINIHIHLRDILPPTGRHLLTFRLRDLQL